MKNNEIEKNNEKNEITTHLTASVLFLRDFKLIAIPTKWIKCNVHAIPFFKDAANLTKSSK